ncbi:MAG TPA: alpha-2-macroglobulin family protein [Pyrinomonadaceae bacterium]|nr:alpha-2-macroglobulin family protein [Pyrinomonadaceae bacterium]
MKTIILSISAFAFLLLNAVAQQPNYSQLKNDAEAQYAQGSYARANEIYSRVDKSKLNPTEVRWVEFRLADTSWRAEAATQTSDTTRLEQAQKQLEELIRVKDKDIDRDLVRAEAHESLGDFFWRRGNANWGNAWPHYLQALDWWAGQRDINLARDRYVRIVFRAERPPLLNNDYYYTIYGNYIPLDVLENALKISTSANDISHLNFLIAMTMRYTGGNYTARYRVPDQFEEALKAGKNSDWYDDALFHYAQWMGNYGSVQPLEDGQLQEQPDYEKALELYRRLLREFSKGESRYYDSALEEIKNITEASMSIAVSNIFLPDSELMFALNARNVRRVDLALYKIDLTRDVHYISSVEEEDGESDPAPWIQRVPTAGRAPVKTWSKNIPDSQSHKPFSEQSRIEGKLPVGAYLLEAKGGSLTSREIVLVSDATLVLKSSSTQALAFFTNALTGAPIANATVALWESYYLNGRWRWRRVRQTTDASGLARFQLRSNSDNNRSLYATAAINDRQAFASGYAYTTTRNQGWRIYAFTDRPAYRPKETLQWKLIARHANGGAYSTPANQTIEYVINDPRGSKVTSGKATLNAFGSSWGSLELGEQLPLGEYSITFSEAESKQQIGSAKLFRLEEYKLPEFKVGVKTPEQDGKKKAFRVGEKVEVEIQADYYFGGPVSNASVEVVVYQLPFYHYWYRPREYSWYYDDMEIQRQNYYGGQGSVVKRETIKTDATGKAKLTFDTPGENYNQDYEFNIEARVVDSSRREILSSDRVRVTRQRYYVYPRSEKYIYRPQDKVTVDIKALDANEQPVQTEGVVKVTRDYWWEIWIDPRGREVKGEELRQLQQRSEFFPPVTPRGQGRWRLKFRGYQRDEILTQTLKTDAEGVAQLNFTPEREGYYRVAWQSSQGADPKRDRLLPPVKAETYVFVATNTTTDLGYRREGLELVVDKDTFRAGQVAPVMINVPAADRYVLFSVEGEDLFSYQVVHVTGNTKLIEVPIEEKHIPNIYLSALMISDANSYSDTKQVVVPPVERFLQVAVNADREQYQPREEGTLAISAKDAYGRPVSAEIALGLVDESVKYIQQDYAGDPRQFYYGQKRPHAVQTSSTLDQKGYARYVEVEPGELRDSREVIEYDEVPPVRRDGGYPAAGVGAADKSENNFKLDGLATRSIRGQVLKDSAGNAPAPTPVPNAATAQEPAVQVRSDFRSTILWLPDVKTDADGTATVKVKYPDSLTTWSATARVVTAGNQFGIGNSTTRTKQPLIVRLQAPRFFVVGDQVTVSGVINNNTNEAMMVTPELNADGLSVTGLLIDGKPVNSAQTPIEVKANSEARVDWLVAVTHASEAKLKVEARGSKYADAMEKKFTIFEHGIEKFVSRSGKMRGDNVSIKLDIPKERRADSTKLTVQIAPSMATTMLDALPYLIDYPYGCTEQTMSRFLPAVITAKTLRDLGLKPETAMHKIFGGIEESSATATHPNGRRDLKELDDITKKSLQRLYDFQHTDGGWGWWKDGDSDHFMTAYVIWGMSLARQAGIDVKSDALERAVAFLDKELVEEETSYDAQAWMLHSLAVYHATRKQTEVSKFQNVAFDNLWKNRDRLNAYTRALLALAAHNYGYRDQAKTLVANLENGVKIDSRPDTSIVQQGAQSSDPSVMGTAHWGEDGVYWHWSEGGVEATSFVLRALLAIDPQNKLIEPVTNWLVKNRRGAQWSNTRDTAIVVLTLNDYLRVSGEVQGAMSYQLVVNGSAVATKQITAEDALSAPSKFAISRELLRDGANEISIVRNSGSGSIYFSAAAEFFSLEEPLKPAGNEIFVKRQYFKLVNHPTLLKGFVTERVPLNDGETVKSGDRVEVVLTVEAKNNYEYLLFEDLKPAGLEAVQIRSGESLFVRQLKSGGGFTGQQRWVYQELRDRKVALFIDKLPQGVWQLSYEMRAEVPGQFHALPVLGHAMYVPEIRTNGAETRLQIVD